MTTRLHDRRSLTQQRFMVIVAMAFVLALGASVQAAQEAVWKRTYAVEISLGESMSISFARAEAVAKARQMASFHFGQAVVARTELVGERMEDRVKVITAGIARATLLEEEPRTDPAGGLRVRFTVEVVVDENELERQLATLRQRENMEHRVAMLERERDYLKARLAAQEGASGSSGTPRVAFRAEPDTNGTTLAFQRGALAATSTADAHDNEVRAIFEEHVFARLASVVPDLELQRIEPAVGGINVTLTLGWSVDLERMRARVYESKRIIARSEGGGLQRLCFDRDFAGVSERTRAAMQRELFLFELTLGNRTYVLPFAGFFDASWCALDGSEYSWRRIHVQVDEPTAHTVGSIRVRVVRRSDDIRDARHSMTPLADREVRL